MTADGEQPSDEKSEQEYRTLRPAVRLDETVASVDPDPVPDPERVRNVDQHRALRDD